MARKSQRKNHGPDPVGGHHPAQQASTTGSNGADVNAKAKAIAGVVLPVLSFPFTTTYPPELEIADFVDRLETTSDLEIQTTAQHQYYLDHENQIQYSYVPLARSWDQQPQVPQWKYSSQNQTPLSIWKSEALLEEPFNDLGKVASNYAGRREGEAASECFDAGKR